jgi:hypothetical protein
MTIHTVVLCASKKQGVAFGLNELARPIRIYLMTPRAVEHAMEQLECFAQTYARSRPINPERVRRLAGGRRTETWSLR